MDEVFITQTLSVLTHQLNPTTFQKSAGPGLIYSGKSCLILLSVWIICSILLFMSQTSSR